MLGAGLGYGAGWLGEQVMPDKWERGKLRRTLAIMGGLGAAAPAGLWAASNVHQGKPWNSGEALQTPKYDLSGAPQKLSDQFNLNPYPDVPAQSLGAKYFPKESGVGSAGFTPNVNVDEFNAIVWNEPRLPLATRAAASGLITGASALRGGARFVTPMDVARLTAGMGSGYLSGAVIGKALGALTGMPASAQERLRTTGLYAGVVANLVPLAFGM